MRYDPQRHHRDSIRLPAYDYAQPGAYFLTVVTHQRHCLFGEIVDGRAVVNGYGEVVEQEWLRSAQIRQEIDVDAFIVMPNHIHGIIISDVGAHGRAPLRSDSPRSPYRPPRSLGSLVAGFKAAATKCINEMRGSPGLPVWQRNYYERVIRDDAELNRVGQYITDNPALWGDDPENPTIGA